MPEFALHMNDHTPEQPLTPRSYAGQTLRALWENLHTVLLGGLIFSVICAPAFVLFILGWTPLALLMAVLTTAPAWTGLLDLADTLLRGKRIAPLTLLRRMRQSAPHSIRLGVLTTWPFVGVYNCARLLNDPNASALAWIGFALFALAALVLFAFALYAFPLLVLRNATAHSALRDGALLAARYVTHTMGLVSMAVLGGFAIGVVSPAFLFLLPAFFSVFVMNNCRLTLGLEQQRTRNDL